MFRIYKVRESLTANLCKENIEVHVSKKPELIACNMPYMFSQHRDRLELKSRFHVSVIL